ncbi:hypothetical protein [Deinococcus yunweiensis]|uniref:hypothetical protein n=1 Tax=Deinococcus yunweiensis TaxID=367282 RepID=UPI00398F7F58
MGRTDRFSRYEFAPWPDKGLSAAVNALARPMVTRLEQRWADSPALTVELSDMDAPEDGRPVVRLEWDSFHRQVFALEVFDEFYSGPYAHAYAWRRGTERRFLHEIVNFPNPWIEEILADNPAVGAFPPYVPPVAARPEMLADNPSWPEPTGRFYRPGDQVSGGLDVVISWPDGEEADLGALQAEGRQMREQWEAEQRSRPRYRHLCIASDSGMVEVLCAGLPTWTRVE